jgi:hypothetical protein
VRQVVVAVALAACALAIALPWELKAGLKSITMCSGLRPFLGTGSLLVIPLLIASSLAVIAVIALHRRRAASLADVAVLALATLPAVFLWMFLHRWRCVSDAPPYNPPLTPTELPYVPAIITFFGHQITAAIALAAADVAVVFAAAWAMWRPRRTGVPRTEVSASPAA